MPNSKPAGLFRRMAALFYDLIIVFALLLVGTLLILPLEHGQAVPPSSWLYDTYLLFLISAYFVISWCHGGQTIGMRAWQLQVKTIHNTKLSYRMAFARLSLAVASNLVFGLGLWWLYVDAQQQTLYDRYCKTTVSCS